MKVFLVILVIGIFLYFYYKTILVKTVSIESVESFVSAVIGNQGVLPKNDIDSIPVHTVVQNRYRNMYYYEYPDSEYEDILIHILSKPTNAKNQDEFIDYISNIINNSDKLKNTQIVDKNIHNNSIELLLYRKNKYQGKHVKFITNDKWNIVSIKVIGSVPEDQIALFPVFPLNPSESENLIITNKFDDSKYTFLNDKDALINSSSTNEIIAFDNTAKNLILSDSKLFNENAVNNLIQETVTPGMSEKSMNLKFTNI